MKERPIIFSGPMVRAILEGRKTQTRRVVKPQPVWDERQQEWQWDHAAAFCAWSGKDCAPTACALIGLRDNCPHGSVGDRLWVRETWRCRGGREYEYQHHQPSIIYRADVRTAFDDVCCEWRPSIYMPHWASRITLEITGVRVERLQEISEEDAMAEGIKPSEFAHNAYQVPGENMVHYVGTAKEAFECLWESIHGQGSWDTNPWVWVIEFKCITN